MKTFWVIFLIGFLVFGNCLFNQFVWDDKTFIQFNPGIHILNLSYLAGPNMFNNVNAGQYRFLVALYFTVLHSLLGENTFFYHLIQIGLHIANSVMVLFLLKRFFKYQTALGLSLIFLVHPIQVESVSYIAAAGNPLFVLFGLGALVLSMKIGSEKKDAAIFGMLLLSLFSKETGILFVGLVLLYRWIYARKETVKYLGLGMVTIFIYAFIRFFLAGVYFSKVTLAPITRLSFGERLINIPAVLLYYLRTFFYPKSLIIEQYWTVLKPSNTDFFLPLIFSAIIFLSITILGVYIKKNKKELFNVWIFFYMWFISGMGMYSQLFSLDMTVADRWFYFPMIGFLGILALVWEIWPIGKVKYQVIIFGIILSGLSIRTIIRNTDWRDPITLYTHDAKIMDNYDLENSLGAELNILGKTNEAIPHFEKSIRLFPHETNLFNLGLAYEGLGELQKAQKYYSEAINVKNYNEVPKPHIHHSVTYERLAIVLLKSDPQKALQIGNLGVKDYPDSAQLWYTKALAEYKLNNPEQALVSAKNAYLLLPDNQNTKNLYQQLMQKKGVFIN